jgi:hypothetical protein
MYLKWLLSLHVQVKEKKVQRGMNMANVPGLVKRAQISSPLVGCRVLVLSLHYANFLFLPIEFTDLMEIFYNILQLS